MSVESDVVLKSLAEAIRSGTTMAWALEHVDALSHAWEASDNPYVMRDLVRAIGRDGPLFGRSYIWCGNCTGRAHESSRDCRACLARIRAGVPRLTLDDVLRSLSVEHAYDAIQEVE